MAFSSNETGRHEVSVVPFPNAADARWAVSTGGGRNPRWSPAGDEIFFLDAADNMVSIPVETEPTFVPGKPEAMFGGFYADYYSPTYDVSPDGQRFLVLKEPATDDAIDLLVVLNFFEELKRLVPVDEP